MNLEGVRKWIGYFSILVILLLSALWIEKGIYSVFAKYAFMAFLVFVGGNSIEHIVKKLK